MLLSLVVADEKQEVGHGVSINILVRRTFEAPADSAMKDTISNGNKEGAVVASMQCF